MVALVRPVDRRARAVAPARPALAREQRQHVSPWASGAIAAIAALGLLGLGELRELAQPGDDAAAVRQRAAEQDPLRVGAVAPQRGRRARAARRGRARAARRSCRPSAPRARACRSRRRGSSIAPSPQAGNHGTSASAGQRSAHSPVRPERGASSIGGSLSSTPSSSASSRSHWQLAWSSSPVPEAIETLAAASPSRRRWTYSPGETQVRTRANVSGLRVAAARRASRASSSSAGGSRCGRGSARSSSRSRSAAAWGAERASA